MVWFSHNPEGRRNRLRRFLVHRLLPGDIAQLVERCDRTAEVRGSNPLVSTPKNRTPLCKACGFLLSLFYASAPGLIPKL